MKAMIMDMCILSHKTQCFFDVRTCRRRRRGQTEGFYRKCYMLCHVGSHSPILSSRSNVKGCQTLPNASDSKLLAPEKVFCFQMFLDKLINSPKNIDPVLRPREARNRPESPVKKKKGFCDGNCSQLIHGLIEVRKILSGNILKPWSLPWKIGVSCSFVHHPTKKVDEPADRIIIIRIDSADTPKSPQPSNATWSTS